ncbi:MAG: hypothetical protein K5641_00735 [Lachnospiraceae bacterium]|nr:hypothetical protein [Lachnospiraceae bacterium]
MADYELIKEQAAAFAEAENDYVPLLANVSPATAHRVPRSLCRSTAAAGS